MHGLEKRYYQNKTQLRYNFGSVYIFIYVPFARSISFVSQSGCPVSFSFSSYNIVKVCAVIFTRYTEPKL